VPTRIRVLTSPPETAPEQLANGAVVVIDVLTCTSFMSAALAAGARALFPARDASHAARLAREAPGPLLTAGEKGGRKLDGFDLHVMPHDCLGQRVGGRNLIVVTTNGTPALVRVGSAPLVLIASLTNMGAVARYLSSAGCDEAVLVCAGNHGRPAAEDLLCAGGILQRLGGDPAALRCGDTGLLALALWHRYGDRPEELLYACGAGRFLASEGFAPAIAACAEVDRWDRVPLLRDGSLQ
jgi:2-phosphosulfolactate phosphatase